MKNIIFLCFFSLMLSQNILVENDFILDKSSGQRSSSREEKILVRIIEISNSEDLSTGVYIGDSWYSGFSYSQRYLGQCPADELLYDSYEGYYSYFNECMAQYAVNEINYQLSAIPEAPDEIFELFSYHRIYDELNFNSPDGHTMLSDYYADTTINTPGYLNIIVTNSMSIPNSSEVLAGTTYLYQDLFDNNGGLLLVESESTPFVLVHELGHVVGFPHLLSDYYLETFSGDSILIEAIDEPDCQPNYMSSWTGSECEFPSPNSTEVGDINGDGYEDIVSAFSNGFGYSGGLSWHEMDSMGNSVNHLIDQDPYAFELSLDDIDFDGDLDILLASKDLFGSEGYFSLYINDGSSNFEKITLGTHIGAISIEAFDMDGDSDLDIIGGSYGDDTIAIYLNDGNLNFEELIVSSNAGDVFDINIVDMDSDGDPDIIAAAKSSQDLSWYENNGSLVFEKHIIVSDWSIVNGPMTALPLDFDFDGDIDIISFGAYDTRVYLGINNGEQDFQDIYVGIGYQLDLTNPKKVDLVDMDGDLDLDFICAYENGIAAFINEGNNSFSAHNIIATDNATDFSFIDILNNGMVDIVVSEHNNYMDEHDFYISVLQDDGATEDFPYTYNQNPITEALRLSFNTDLHGEVFGQILDSWLEYHSFESSIIDGDTNGDEIVNILDIVILVNLVLSDAYFDVGDMNNDDILNILDIVILVGIILNN